MHISRNASPKHQRLQPTPLTVRLPLLRPTAKRDALAINPDRPRDAGELKALKHDRIEINLSAAVEAFGVVAAHQANAAMNVVQADAALRSPILQIKIQIPVAGDDILRARSLAELNRAGDRQRTLNIQRCDACSKRFGKCRHQIAIDRQTFGIQLAELQTPAAIVGHLAKTARRHAGAIVLPAERREMIDVQSESFALADVEGIYFNGGDGDDVFANDSDIGSIALGGCGNDTLIGGSGPDVLLGGAGDDTVIGEPGDVSFGGAGDNHVLSVGGEAEEPSEETPTEPVGESEDDLADACPAADDQPETEPEAVEDCDPADPVDEVEDPSDEEAEACDTTDAEPEPVEETPEPVAETDDEAEVCDSTETEPEPVDEGDVAEPVAEGEEPEACDVTEEEPEAVVETEDDCEAGESEPTDDIEPVTDPEAVEEPVVCEADPALEITDGEDTSEPEAIDDACTETAGLDEAPAEDEVVDNVVDEVIEEPVDESEVDSVDAPLNETPTVMEVVDDSTDCVTEEPEEVADDSSEEEAPAEEEVVDTVVDEAVEETVTDDDVLIGGTGNDLIMGGDGDDWMFGGDLDETLLGLALQRVGMTA